MVRTACAGGGLPFGMEETFMPNVERGNWRLSLETFCPRFPGFYIYGLLYLFPDRRNLSAEAPQPIDHMRYRPAADE